jgi:hypothetical protein
MLVDSEILHQCALGIGIVGRPPHRQYLLIAWGCHLRTMDRRVLLSQPGGDEVLPVYLLIWSA